MLVVKKLSNHPHIELISRAALVPNVRNPRKHGDKQLRKIAASIERFGFLVPLIVDDVNTIVAGHARWRAAGLIGIDEVPVIRVKFMSDADKRAFALAENRLPELAEWDQALLNAELEALFAIDYDLDITGFSLSDLDFTTTDDKPSTVSEQVALPDPDAKAVSRLGDLWQVGLDLLR